MRETIATVESAPRSDKMKEEHQKVLHYRYTCKLTGKSALAPFWSTGFPGNFVDCKVIIIDRTKLEEPCKSCDLDATREEAGFH